MNIMRRKRSILPGFGISLGYTIFYLSLLVLIPLGYLVFRSFDQGLEHFIKAISGKRVAAAYLVSFQCALVAATINTALGLVVAWVLVRYRFPGRRLLDAVVDLPFALPTAVAGIALATLYAPGAWLGGMLAHLGIAVTNSATGIVVALVFVGFPFVIRTLQPVLEELEPELEEAASSLGASRWQSFWRVILPSLVPGLLTGFTLAFARGLGEYGSVIFIAGNLPLKTEIAPLLIMSKLDQFDYTGAAAIAVVLLAISFFTLLVLNLLQAWKSNAGR